MKFKIKVGTPTCSFSGFSATCTEPGTPAIRKQFDELQLAVNFCCERKATQITFIHSIGWANYGETSLTIEVQGQAAEKVYDYLWADYQNKFWGMLKANTSAKAEAERVRWILMLRSHGKKSRGTFYPPYLFDTDWRIKLNLD